MEKTAALAAFCASAQSLETADAIQQAFLAPFSLVPKSRFPETETAVAETGSIEALLSGEAEHLALA